MTPPDTSANAAPAEAPLEALSPQALRAALGRFATGVTLITCRDADGAPVGLTANSFTSLSLDPPMVLWSLRRASASLPAFTAAPHFAVNVLAETQVELSRRFASPQPDKFADVLPTVQPSQLIGAEDPDEPSLRMLPDEFPRGVDGPAGAGTERLTRIDRRPGGVRESQAGHGDPVGHQGRQQAHQ
jgi:hypothetical protein